MKLPSVGEVSKALAALSVGVGVMVAAGLITGSPAVWITTAIGAVSTALGVFAAPRNQPPQEKP